jgi:hypothetical protein
LSPDTHAPGCASYVPSSDPNGPWGNGAVFPLRCDCHVATIRQQEAELTDANRRFEILQVMWKARLEQCNQALSEPTPHLEKSIEALIAGRQQQEAELKRLRDTLHSIDAVLLKESPIERLHVSTSMERRILRMITVAFEVE